MMSRPDVLRNTAYNTKDETGDFVGTWRLIQAIVSTVVEHDKSTKQKQRKHQDYAGGQQQRDLECSNTCIGQREDWQERGQRLLQCNTVVAHGVPLNQVIFCFSEHLCSGIDLRHTAPLRIITKRRQSSRTIRFCSGTM